MIEQCGDLQAVCQTVRIQAPVFKIVTSRVVPVLARLLSDHSAICKPQCECYVWISIPVG